MAGKKNNNFHYSIFWKFWKYDQNRLFISFQTFTIFKTRIRMMPTEVRINFRRHLKSANWLVHRHRVEPLKFETSNLGQRNKGLCFAPDVAKLATFYAKVDLLMTPDQFFSRECKKSMISSWFCQVRWPPQWLCFSWNSSWPSYSGVCSASLPLCWWHISLRFRDISIIATWQLQY